MCPAPPVLRLVLLTSFSMRSVSKHPSALVLPLLTSRRPGPLPALTPAPFQELPSVAPGRQVVSALSKQPRFQYWSGHFRLSVHICRMGWSIITQECGESVQWQYLAQRKSLMTFGHGCHQPPCVSLDAMTSPLPLLCGPVLNWPLLFLPSHQEPFFTKWTSQSR